MKKKELLLNDYACLCKEADHLEPEMFDKYEVQRGLRDKNGNGVVTGLTNISRIDAFKMESKPLVRVSCGTGVMTVSNW